MSEYLSDEVMTAIIVAVQAITITVIGTVSAKVSKVRKDTDTVKSEVKNTHSANLRDDLDNKHNEMKKYVRGVDVRLSKALEAINDRLTIHENRDLKLDDRLDIIAKLVINERDK